MRQVLSNRYIRYILPVIAGLLLGWLFFHSPVKEDKHEHATETKKGTIWTCAMHPQIRMDHPGKCPICGMDLIPLNQSTATIDPDAVHLTKEAIALANVATSVVSRQKPVKELRLYGKVQADERLIQSQVAHVPGRIEKLFVNFTGESVRKGQPLALIYSPELITAQQELLEAAKTKTSQPEIYEAAREKLKLWKLSNAQISSVESSGKIQNYFQILSNTNGIITDRLVNAGDYVQQGTGLFNVSDLSRVWVMFDAYESDLPFIKTGENLSFKVQAVPGKDYSGKISFIDPVMDPVTRVSKVRVEVSNPSGQLKPEMFTTGLIKANLQAYQNKLVIPKSAVLWTGKRSIVYVKQSGDEPAFKMREIELGPVLGSSYVVLDGLHDGEEIVTQGTFNVDAAAQLDGKPSMMNPSGGETSSMPGMDMQHGSTGKPESNPPVSSDFKMQMNGIFDHYIILKNALVETDAKKAGIAARNLQAALASVDMKQLSGDSHEQWMTLSDLMNKQISSITSSTNIEAQRSAFAGLSDQMYKAVKNFGMMGKTGYYQFCPMFNNNKGAHWISEIKEIKNPYYGQAMLTCGENKETLR